MCLSQQYPHNPTPWLHFYLRLIPAVTLLCCAVEREQKEKALWGIQVNVSDGLGRHSHLEMDDGQGMTPTNRLTTVYYPILLNDRNSKCLGNVSHSSQPISPASLLFLVSSTPPMKHSEHSLTRTDRHFEKMSNLGASHLEKSKRHITFISGINV